MPGARCAAAAGPKEKGTRAKSPRSHRNNPAFPAQWFYGVLRALPGDQACLTPSPALLSADLTPASGRQNDTTWPYASAAFVTRANSVHRIPPRVRNVRNAPLRDGTMRDIEVIWVRRQAKFLKFGNSLLDRILGTQLICPSGKFMSSHRSGNDGENLSTRHCEAR